MKYFVSKLVDGLEYLLGLGGMKRDIAFLIISGVALLLSLFDAPLPFSAAWVAIILCGVPIVTEAFIGIITKFDIKADLLVSLALIASVIIGEDFAAGEVAFIMQLGSLLEELTVAKARAGIEKLVHLSPQKARLITPENEQIVPAEAVKVGDLLRVLPGETIPVDGVIISGHTSVNQAVMTGESLPVDKEPGDEVSSGTVNQFGAFDMRAAKVGEDSSIQRMIRLVQSADAGKAKIVGIADRWATWIVVIALTSAALTWFFTGEIIRAVTILVGFVLAHWFWRRRRPSWLPLGTQRNTVFSSVKATRLNAWLQLPRLLSIKQGRSLTERPKWCMLNRFLQISLRMTFMPSVLLQNNSPNTRSAKR